MRSASVCGKTTIAGPPRCAESTNRVLDDDDPRARGARSRPPSGSVSSQERRLKDNVLDLLIYLFENYMSADDEPRPDRNTLKLELDKAGEAAPHNQTALGM